MLEEAAHAFWKSRELAHVADEVAFEFCPTACGRPRGDAPLDVAVDSFVQIEFRAVSGQVVHLDLGAVLRQPRLDGTGAMYRQPVHDGVTTRFVQNCTLSQAGEMLSDDP